MRYGTRTITSKPNIPLRTRQFVNMLDLILWRLTAEGVKCAKLSGHMSVTARDTALRAFKENPDVKVLLISLKAGGVALNLTHANHIFLSAF